MALIKDIKNDKGMIYSYHRIANVTQNYINITPMLEIYVYHYSSGDYRDIEKEKLKEDRDFQNIVGTDVYNMVLDEEKGVDRASLYERMINEIPEYAGSEKG